MNKAFLSLGGNIGNPAEALKTAQEHIANQVGKIARASHSYQTKAWGKTDQPDFLNQVVLVTTKLTAKQLIEKILAIEQQMGRMRTKKNDARIIDIDILFFNEEVIQLPHLTIPHPLIQDRNFVLAPLAEIAQDFIHPLLKKPIRELYQDSQDSLEVKKISAGF